MSNYPDGMTPNDYDHVEGVGAVYTGQYTTEVHEPPCMSCGEHAPIDTEETDSHYREWCHECNYLLCDEEK